MNHMDHSQKLHRLAGLDISAAGPRCKMLLGDLDGDGRAELLLVQPDNRQDVRYIPHQVQCLTTQSGRPSAVADGNAGPGRRQPRLRLSGADCRYRW